MPAQIDREALATRLASHAGTRHPYILNINHPAIHTLFYRFKVRGGHSQQYPLSSEDRLAFELQLLNSAALRELEAYCDSLEQKRPPADSVAWQPSADANRLL